MTTHIIHTACAALSARQEAGKRQPKSIFVYQIGYCNRQYAKNVTIVGNQIFIFKPMFTNLKQ